MVRTSTRQLLAHALLLAPLALTGCAIFDKPDPNRPDPLTGLPKRVPAGERGVSATSNPADANRNGVLASSGPRPADGTSGLSIRDSRAPEADRSTQPSGTWTGSESHSNAGAKPAGVTTASADGAAGGPRVRTFEEAQQFLVARGVRWQDLQTTGEGEWKYSCSVPSKANANSVRTYEARDRYGLLAMQKVIDQILREQQGR
jgi:hypothetical protein